MVTRFHQGCLRALEGGDRLLASEAPSPVRLGDCLLLQWKVGQAWVRRRRDCEGALLRGLGDWGWVRGRHDSET